MRRLGSRGLSCLLLLLAAGSLPGTVATAQAVVNPGDALVLELGGGSFGIGALYRVDPTTGTRVVLSDFGDESQGPIGGAMAVAIGPSGQILLLGGGVLAVDPSTGQRTFVFDAANAPPEPPSALAEAGGLAVEPSGQILVFMWMSATETYALGRIDPTTGTRTILSDFGNVSQGPLAQRPQNITVEAGGTILVSDMSAGTNRYGAIFRVNPVTGTRTMLSDFGDLSQGPPADLDRTIIRGLAVEASGQIVAADESAGTVFSGHNGRGALFRVDRNTGQRTRFSDWGEGASAILAAKPISVAVEASGRILAVDYEYPGGLIRVDPVTGERSVLSNFGDIGQGPRLCCAWAVTVVPNTPAGTDVVAEPVDSTTDTRPLTVTFASVSQPGNTSLTTSSSAPPIPSGFKLGTPATFYELTTTAVFGGTIEVCIDYSRISVGNESKLKLFHYENGHWTNATTSLDTVNDIICGSVTSLSPFAVLEEDKVPYQFSGFFSPVDNPPTMNVGKAGSGVPVKFSLGGNQGLAIFEAGYPQSQAISCSTTGPVDALEVTATAGASTLTYDASSDRYTYVWKTEKAWAGYCRQLVLKLNDGTSHIASFKFTK